MSTTAGKSCSSRLSSEKTSPQLVFILQTGGKKSKDVQTQIRKHVMKDIGKSRRKEKRGRKINLEVPPAAPSEPRVNDHPPRRNHQNTDNTDSTIEVPHIAATAPDSSYGSVSDGEDASQTVPHLQGDLHDILKQAIGWHQASAFSPGIDRLWTGRMDPFVRYPVELNDRTRELVDLAFDDRYVNVGPFRDACLPVGMMDPAAFHQVLSNALLNISCRRTETSPETNDCIKHHALAVKSVNERITDPNFTISDGFIGAIIGFACYYSYTGNQAAWRMHLQGIEEIIRLRGGIHTLDNNKVVRMLLGWSDIGGCSIEDAPPIFPLPLQLLPDQNALRPCPQISHQAFHVFHSWITKFPNHLGTLDVLRFVSRFSSHLKVEAVNTNRKIFSDGDFGTGYLFPLLHQCLSLPRYNPDVTEIDGAILQATRLACTLFLAELKRMFGINAVNSTLQTQKLRGYLESSKGHWGELHILRLWCFAMGGIESIGPLQDWYAQELRVEGAMRGLYSWKDIEIEVKSIIWFDECHSSLFAELGLGVKASSGLNALGGRSYPSLHRPFRC
ncbi:hypothetical protein N431DRAFT_375200 [Stipitochalara longipes BDJ]|nr:hypothetical protein N431DRAFT_375200 [Stipitochalara longipes BDJ]